MARFALAVAALLAVAPAAVVGDGPIALRGPWSDGGGAPVVAEGAAPGKRGRSSVELAEATPAIPKGILKHMEQQVGEVMRGGSRQWIVALIAFALGAVLVYDGEMSFRAAIVCAVFLFAGVIGESDIAQVWPSATGTALGRVVGLEAGLLGVTLACAGIDGVVLAFGAILGGLVASKARVWFVAMGCDKFESDVAAVVALYTAVVGLFIFCFRMKKHVRLVVLISAAVGATLVASSLAWWVAHLVLGGHLHFVRSAFPDVAPVGGDWIDFLLVLWSADAQDVGVFADSRYNLKVGGAAYRTDRVVGVSLAAVIFFVSSRAQFRFLREVGARELRSGLQRALLSEE